MEFIAGELPRVHAAPWRHTTRAAVDSAAAALLRRDADLPLFTGPNAFTRLPVRFYRFADTLRVITASSSHRELLGARVLRFGTMPVGRALRAIEPYLANDNAARRRLATGGRTTPVDGPGSAARLLASPAFRPRRGVPSDRCQRD